ncbi:MAG: NAD-dependent epimerase/dehydratase [Parvularculaceae bacterium]|nr:NAD-dependent epimerase/dehydratase [Parvularculaceae bacterium]
MTASIIIGAGGFLGSHLSKNLLARGRSVTAILKPSTNTELLRTLAPGAEIRRIAPDDAAGLTRLFEERRSNTIYYVAGSPRLSAENIFDEVEALLQPAMLNLLAVLRAAAQCKFPPPVFVRAGTLAEYGDAPTPHSEEMRCIPSTVYGACALCGSRMLEVVGNSMPFRVANARLALMYGWGQSAQFLLPLMIERFLSGKPVTINDPDAVRDLIHVDDACEALIALADTQNATPGPINIGSGEALSMGDAAEIILQITGAARSLVLTGDPSKRTGSRRLEMTTDRAAELVGWRARIGFRDGIQSLIEEVRHNEGKGR